MAQIEIELRSRFDEAKYTQLLAFLNQHAEDLGVDDKNLYFYLLPGKLLKVVDNTAQGTAKISFKDGRIGQGTDFPEIDITIAPTDVPDAVRMFNGLGFAETMHEAFNRRHNFRYRDVEIAVKWSEAWGHHAEFEVLLPEEATSDQKAAAKQLIHDVAHELDLQLMSEAELAEFDRQFQAAQAAKQRRT